MFSHQACELDKGSLSIMGAEDNVVVFLTLTSSAHRKELQDGKLEEHIYARSNTAKQ